VRSPPSLGCGCGKNLIQTLYLHWYLQNSNFIFFLCFVFWQKSGFMRFSGLFISFSLVYTNILEQKRIAGQA